MASYLLGSIPFGYLIVSATTGADIRQTGSHGTGATNVSRSAGKGAGILTLLLDALKGAAAIIMAGWLISGFNNSSWWIGLAGILAMLGHIFPIWLRFQGGKGVATAIGVFSVLAPLPLLATGLLFVVIVWLTRYVSLGSIVGAATLPIFIWIASRIHTTADASPLIVISLIVACLIIYAHRANIGRLLSKTESKF